MGDMREVGQVLSEIAKENHRKRMEKNPDRVSFAIQQFKRNGINYKLRNEAIGHFHCFRKSDGKLFQFWAGTGKIIGYENKRGIRSLISLLLE